MNPTPLNTTTQNFVSLPPHSHNGLDSPLIDKKANGIGTQGLPVVSFPPSTYNVLPADSGTTFVTYGGATFNLPLVENGLTYTFFMAGGAADMFIFANTDAGIIWDNTTGASMTATNFGGASVTLVGTNDGSGDINWVAISLVGTFT